ncbi:MAG: BMP family ABC transporter substrate-binding protein, partial [Spirochaetales bacterium]|nr:BMP family ABC transporter substrate-binding protein [Spirochaetales bacterium]
EVPSSEMRVAMITDYGDVNDHSLNQVTYEGCVAFAEANNLIFAYYKPTADSTEARVSVMETAINAGYNVIVLPGYMFGGPIVEVAPQHKNVKFIALDVAEDDILSAVPGSSYSMLGDLLSNVYCMVYQEEIAGFLAGYAAVKMGYTHLGFCGGVSFPYVKRYGYGFVQGADIAANELDVEVDLQYAYANQFFGDAYITAAMDDMYLNGAEIVLSCGGGLWSSVASAASKVGGKVIGCDVDQAYTIDGCYGSGITVTSAVKGFYPSVYSALQGVLDGHWADMAGCIANLGLISSTNPDLNYVGIPTGEGTAWNDGFTLEDYKEIIARIINSNIVVSNDCSSAQPTANTITINYIGNIK